MLPDSSGLVRASPRQVLGSVKYLLIPFTELNSDFLALRVPLCSLIRGVDLLLTTLVL